MTLFSHPPYLIYVVNSILKIYWESHNLSPPSLSPSWGKPPSLPPGWLQHLLTGLPTYPLGLWKGSSPTLQVMILLRCKPDQLQDEPPGNPPIIHWTKLHSLRNLLYKEAPFTPVPLAFSLDRHTFSSQGLRTYYSAGMLSPWYLSSTLPNFTQVFN